MFTGEMVMENFSLYTTIFVLIIAILLSNSWLFFEESKEKTDNWREETRQKLRNTSSNRHGILNYDWQGVLLVSKWEVCRKTMKFSFVLFLLTCFLILIYMTFSFFIYIDILLTNI